MFACNIAFCYQIAVFAVVKDGNSMFVCNIALCYHIAVFVVVKDGELKVRPELRNYFLPQLLVISQSDWLICRCR